MKRLLVLIVLLVALPTTAHAHGDTGTLELLEATVLDDGVRYVVLLTYANDGETVPDTKVTVAVDGTAPVAMSYEGEGRYAATVPAPEGGAHDVVFSSEEPAATLTYRQEADAQQTSTTTEAPNVADEPLPDPDEAQGGAAWLLVLMAIIVVAMVVVALAYVRGRRPPP